jgi:hypothetical protein
MAVADTLACYDITIITAAISFITQAPEGLGQYIRSLLVCPWTFWQLKKEDPNTNFLYLQTYSFNLNISQTLLRFVTIGKMKNSTILAIKPS